MRMPEKGDVYRVGGQGTGISPITVAVTVVWVDPAGDAIHYRKGTSKEIHETSLTRFLKIVDDKNPNRYG